MVQTADTTGNLRAADATVCVALSRTGCFESMAHMVSLCEVSVEALPSAHVQGQSSRSGRNRQTLNFCDRDALFPGTCVAGARMSRARMKRQVKVVEGFFEAWYQNYVNTRSQNMQLEETCRHMVLERRSQTHFAAVNSWYLRLNSAKLLTRKLSHRRHKNLCSTVKIWIESLGTAKTASLLKLRRAHAFTRRQLRIQQNTFSSWTQHTARSRYYCVSLRRVLDFTSRHRFVCSMRQWREWQGISIRLR
mmetsp:Transcript_2257/g.3632  ORF Transcript_2257/g.3632 Transcript_2257/m.3632 type:complete len:249 (-) Transcript_2257:1125-1871(-)